MGRFQALTPARSRKIVQRRIAGLIMNTNEVDQKIEGKMRSAGMAPPTIAAFLNAVHQVMAGETGLLPESSVAPIDSLPALNDFQRTNTSSELLKQLAIIKLNGGLGTSMGLERAKSLIRVKGEDTF